MDTFPNIQLPMSRETAESLKLGDMITLTGPIKATAGMPTHQRILDFIDEGKQIPIDLVEAAFFHLGSYSRDAEGGMEVLYMNPTTSTRFNHMMPKIIRHFRLRCVGGKGGLNTACAEALKEVGGVYLSFLGGGAPLHSKAIQKIEQVAWTDLVSHYRLVAMDVAELGPLTVAIDAHGNSLYDNLDRSAQERRDQIIEKMNQTRAR
ncbi:fumarate hydratase C-terminal domain-containing protein [Mariluticola halotolerans]|uniref:fumarate hydratase C-terminal domain-containing protein n=1 Tax=Mariluticola halotolerans TaxID=2909283 RepID=UPI0026E2B2D7|nr:fumarate hydratase C-terminal domain-containing protein [Mariluticola halotolerans]UJQ94179.1 fumarate hydratase C-terminal domain-containing protein [Mariluticola halotolerans]